MRILFSMCHWKLLVYRGKTLSVEIDIWLWPTWSGISCTCMLIFVFYKLPNEMRHEAVNWCCSVKTASISLLNNNGISFFWIVSDYEKMPGANSAFCKRPNTVKTIGFIWFLYKLMLLQSFISFVLANIAKLKMFNDSTEIFVFQRQV